MRVVVTGQVGLDKRPYLERVVETAAAQGFPAKLLNIGQMMYAEAPDVAPGRILDLPLSRLQSLRRSVLKDVLATCRENANVIVNTHATFRWRHGLFCAFDYDQMQALDADMYITLVDNVDRVHYRLVRDGHVDHTLKDLMVWREEEMLATELLSQIVCGHGRFYVWARGEGGSNCESLVRLIFRPDVKKAYLSFPMTHVGGADHVLAEIEGFRREMKQLFTCFDPADVEEKALCSQALAAAREGHRAVEAGPSDRRAVMSTSQLMDIIPDIDGQIYARDFKLIDQADMICSLIPAGADGKAVLSSGVERELQHAHEATREVFVVWRPAEAPSPFVSETATGIFGSTGEAVSFLLGSGCLPPPPGGLFGD